MDALLFILGFLGFIVMLVILIINVFRKKPKKKVSIGILICLFMMLAGLSMIPSSEESENKNNHVEPASVSKVGDDVVKEDSGIEDVIYQIGDSFATGDLGITVLEFEEKEEFKSDNQFIDNVTTEGKFIAIRAKLTNNDTKARTFSSMQFKLIDEEDREFSAMTDFNLMMLLGDDNIFLEECNPGMSRTGVFVFEVPTEIETYWLKVNSGVGLAAKTSEVVKLK